MRIYESKWFHRFARRSGIPDSALRAAVARAERGQIDADLGGGVIEQRIARPGEGRSAGYRTILFFRRGAVAFFVYGFAKHRRPNIVEAELEQFKQAAHHVLALSPRQLEELLARGDFLEVDPE